MRVIAYGMNPYGEFVCLNPPDTAERCGMYVHVDDIPEYVREQMKLQIKTEGPDIDHDHEIFADLGEPDIYPPGGMKYVGTFLIIDDPRGRKK
jgi:hypothetical protein